MWRPVEQVQCEKTGGYRECMEANYDGEEAGDGSNKYDGRGNQLKSSMYKNAIRKPVTFCG